MGNLPQGFDIWESVLARIQGEMQKAAFDVHFFGSEATLLDNSTLVVKLRSQNSVSWVKGQFAKRIEEHVEQVAGRPLSIEFEALTPLYANVDELLGEYEDDEGSDAEFEGVYHDERNTIIQPKQVEVHSQYFRKKWRPLLGPLLSELVRELRQRCHRKSRRNNFKTTYKTLALALGVSERTISRALERDDQGVFKNDCLNYFIKDIEVLKSSNGKGSIRTDGTRFVIYLDEPLTPQDQENLRD